jgi:tetratricopeptide (TPR) repeat protein
MSNSLEKIHIYSNKLYIKKKYEDAIEFYNYLIYNNYKIDVIYSNISACYLKLKNYLLALNKALNSVENNINNAKTWARIGYAYKGLKLHKNAYKSFEIALSLDKNNKIYKMETEFYFNRYNKQLTFFNIYNIIKNNNEIYSDVKKLKNNINMNNILTVVEKLFEKL